MDGEVWWAAVYGVAKSRTRLSDFPFPFTFMHWRRKWQPTPMFLPGESQGWWSLVGCRLWGRTESDATEQLSSSSGSKHCIDILYAVKEFFFYPFPLVSGYNASY